MLLKNAVKNIRYVVSKGTKCGTFQKGDHIKVMESGAVLCNEAQGWLDPEDITELVGIVEVVIDSDEIARLKLKVAELQKKIKWMEKQGEQAKPEKKDKTVGRKIRALRSNTSGKRG